jgi:uncharacterized protein (TIGR02996 family)
MSAREELIGKIIANPHDDSLRLALADQLSPDENAMGEIIRLQCELRGLTEQDSGWYWRRFKLANLLRGSNPFLIAFGEESNESVWTAALHAIKHNGLNVGKGTIERGFVESYAVFDVERLKACEEAVMSVAPLIRSFEFSDLRNTRQFEVLAGMQCISQATRLKFSKCHFWSGELERILNGDNCGSVVSLVFSECTFDDGIESLLRTKLAGQIEQLVITLNREQAEGLDKERRFLGSLFTGGSLQSLLSLELDRCCITEDLLQMAEWSGCNRLTDIDLGAPACSVEALQEFLRNDFSSLESLHLSRIKGELHKIDLRSIPKLRLFSLKGPTLSSSSMQTLGESVADCLQHLTISSCELTSSSLSSFLQCKELRCMRYLNLQLNELDCEAAQMIACTPWLEGLVALKLSFNELGQVAAESLERSAVIGNLAFLDLAETKLGDLGAQRIASALASNLQWLNLDTNAITSNSLACLLDLRQMTSLVALRLKGNNVFGDYESEFIKRFGESVVNSYWLGYLI